jgi:Protein of unknown function (DUF3000)
MTETAGAGDRGGADDTVFAVASAGLRAGIESESESRGGYFLFEDEPAPRKLAPFAAAVAAVVVRDGTEVAWGRLIVLYDPRGQESWTGNFRVIAYVRADVEPEIAADPLLGEVGWSWLTDGLQAHAPGYAAPSGTITRVVTEGFGAKGDDESVTEFELRASWSPQDEAVLDAGLAGDVAAWCDVLAAAAGLPPQPPGTRAIGMRPMPGGPAAGRHP